MDCTALRTVFRNAWQWGCILLPVACLAGCAGGPSAMSGADTGAPARPGNFRHIWYAYYERGRTAAAGRDWPAAEADFRRAIARRRADAGLARTYGMHFILYHPNRELGISLLHQDRLDEALACLDAARKTAPTARGDYWLDEARRLELARSGRDGAAPAITPASWPERTANPRQDIVLEATDDTFVKHVTVQGRLLPVGLSAPKVSLPAALELTDGDNEVRIAAVDLAGKETVVTRHIVLDRAGPALSLDASTAESGVTILSGSAADASTVAEVRVDGKVAALHAEDGGTVAFRVELPTRPAEIRLAARDALANETVAVFRPVLTSGGWPVAEPVAGETMAMVKPVDITVRNLRDGMQVFQELVILDLEIRLLEPLASLEIGGVAVRAPKGRNVFLSQRVHLTPGTNTVRVSATDITGRSDTRTITLERMDTGPLGLEGRATLAVAPLRTTDPKREPSARIMRQELSRELLRDRRFREVARDPSEWAALVSSAGAMPSADRALGARAGTLLKADYVLFGDLVPSADGVEFLGRLIDASTGKLVSAPEVYGRDEEELRARMSDLACVLRQTVPLVAGEVTSVSGRDITLNRGSRAALETGRQALVYRADPRSADVRTLGTALVQAVRTDSSTAALREMEAAPAPGDAFITR